METARISAQCASGSTRASAIALTRAAVQRIRAQASRSTLCAARFCAE